MSNKNELVKELIKIANKLDKNGHYESANDLTKIASKISTSQNFGNLFKSFGTELFKGYTDQWKQRNLPGYDSDKSRIIEDFKKEDMAAENVEKFKADLDKQNTALLNQAINVFASYTNFYGDLKQNSSKYNTVKSIYETAKNHPDSSVKSLAEKLKPMLDKERRIQQTYNRL